jgi:16S rRNA (adenine1518-N6/adenine1519-N6)-dimethyltransferase
MSNLLPEIRDICRILEISPARSKGQNFLTNEKIYNDIVLAADIKPNDTVLEIGPGLGFLTLKLASGASRVMAVELDDKLAHYLEMGIAATDIKNIEIYNEDILKFNLDKYLDPNTPYKVVANLPYNITSVFLRLFLSQAHNPELLVLMLQKEVAERIISQAPDMNLLALSVQYYSEPEIVRSVKAGNFWPEPKVDSAVIKLKVRPEKLDKASLQARKEEDKLFFRLAKIGFSAKRKMLKNNLAGGLNMTSAQVADILAENGFNRAARAEDLGLVDWQKLFAALRAFML